MLIPARASAREQPQGEQDAITYRRLCVLCAVGTRFARHGDPKEFLGLRSLNFHQFAMLSVSRGAPAEICRLPPFCMAIS